MATDPHQRLLTAEQFLQIDFGPDIKAELDNGVVRMMAGGSAAHARIQSNLVRFLGPALRGTGCRPFGSDMAVLTHDGSVRYPDLAIYCGRTDAADDNVKAFDDPHVVIEILSASTSRIDQGDKLYEYKAIPTIETIAFVDPDTSQGRVLQRTGAAAWSDVTSSGSADLALPSLDLTIPHAEIFARD